MLGVIATTVFSLYNLNSWFIMLLVFCRLLDGGPVRAIGAAFHSRYFIGYLALFLIDVAGLAYTHNLHEGSHIVEKEATLVALSFVLFAGPFTDSRGYGRLMTAYIGILLAACLYCLAIAARDYGSLPGKNISVFFYHALSHPIGQNAVFFSVFMIFGLLFLLSHPLQTGSLPRRTRRLLQVFLIVFFIAMIVLLSSKLLLIVLFLILISMILRRYIARKNYKAIGGIGIVGLSLIIWLGFTDNPIKKRYRDLGEGNITMIRQDKFTPSTQFNGAQLRLLQWRFANQILREHHAWLSGVSGGDSQDLLNQKYRDAQVDTGIPNTKQHGFLNYNFHNQYIETLVRSGLLGLAILLYVCWLLVEMAVKWQTAETSFTVLSLLLIFTVESFLTMQHGVFAFVFMPLLLFYSPKKGKAASPAPSARP